MNGLDLIRTIRAHHVERIANLPVIALTALAMSGDRESCLAAGANEYLSKPLHLQELLEMIRILLRM
jgi:CheY-like chemotaxis protein